MAQARRAFSVEARLPLEGWVLRSRCAAHTRNIGYDNVYDHFEAFFTVALCFADIYCHPFGGYNVSSEEALKIKKQDYIQPCCGQVTHIHSS